MRRVRAERTGSATGMTRRRSLASLPVSPRFAGVDPGSLRAVVAGRDDHESDPTYRVIVALQSLENLSERHRRDRLRSKQLR